MRCMAITVCSRVEPCLLLLRSRWNLGPSPVTAPMAMISGVLTGIVTASLSSFRAGMKIGSSTTGRSSAKHQTVEHCADLMQKSGFKLLIRALLMPLDWRVIGWIDSFPESSKLFHLCSGEPLESRSLLVPGYA